MNSPFLWEVTSSYIDLEFKAKIMKKFYCLFFLLIICYACEQDQLEPVIKEVPNSIQKEQGEKNFSKSQTVSLNSSGTEFDLGNPVNLDISTTILENSMTYLGYQIVEKDELFDNYSSYLSCSFSMSCLFKAVQPGEWKIRAVIEYSDSYGAQTAYSNEVNINVILPSASEIMANSLISGQMSAAWSQTLSAAYPDGREEKGFMIYMNTMPGHNPYFYEIPDGIESGPQAPCGSKAEIAMSYSDIDNPNYVNGGKYFVGLFHTHTPVFYCTGYSRVTGPSDYDIDNINAAKAPGILTDYSKNPKIYWYDPLDSPTTTSRYGLYDRREYSNSN